MVPSPLVLPWPRGSALIFHSLTYYFAIKSFSYKWCLVLIIHELSGTDPILLMKKPRLQSGLSHVVPKVRLLVLAKTRSLRLCPDSKFFPLHAFSQQTSVYCIPSTELVSIRLRIQRHRDLVPAILALTTWLARIKR